MSIRVALYPFCEQLLPIVKYFDVFQNTYVLDRVLSPRGYGLSGKDAAYVKNQPPTGIIVWDSFDERESSWELLMVIETEDDDQLLEDQKRNYIERALKVGKKVRYYIHDSKNIESYLWELKEKYPLLLSLEYNSVPVESDSLLPNQLTVPVILVGGLISQADTLEITFKLAKYLMEKGEAVCVYTNSPSGKIFGFDTLQHIFKDNHRSEVQKIETIQRFLLLQEKEKRPSVIILEAPDAVMRYNSKAHNGYGIYTYMLSQAVSFDYFICCLSFELSEPGFVNAISKEMDNKYRCGICGVHASNAIVDIAHTNTSGKVSVTYTSFDCVEKFLEKCGHGAIPVFNGIATDAEIFFEAFG